MRVTSTRVLYESPWMRVHEDTVELADGGSGTYGWVEKPPAALIIALEDDHTWLVEQYRHPVRRRLWEFPQGTAADAPDAESVARAELAEETGLRAGRMEHVGRLYYGSALTSQPVDVWRATVLERGAPDLEEAEQGLIARRFPCAEVARMIAGNVIRDAASVAAWHLAKPAA
jgi:8-oxo-dGTP pyrophosphatase MutT (NUDIX family)